tara:strand:- start:1266 stop:1721 length:456 start_codon:yes stop_codon:yes gene_type:complete
LCRRSGFGRQHASDAGECAGLGICDGGFSHIEIAGPVAEIPRQRFLDDGVHTLLQSANRERLVERRRGHDVQDIDLFEQGIEVGKRRAAVLRREGGGLVLVAAMHTDDIDVRPVDTVDAFDMQVCGEPGSDQSGTNFGFLHGSRPKGAEPP